MRDFLNIGCTPPEEDCVQLGVENYRQLAMAECNKYIEALRMVLGKEPQGAGLKVRGFPHDFGSYYEVVCYYDEDLKESVDYAYSCEGNGPAEWPEEMKKADFDLMYPKYDNNLARLKAMQGRFLVLYEPFDEDGKLQEDHSYSQCHDCEDPDALVSEDCLFFEPTYLMYGDYANTTLLEKANHLAFKEDHDEQPGVCTISGGYDNNAILIHVATTIDEVVWDTLEGLQNYPVVDEERHSELEMEEAESCWEDWGKREYVNFVEDKVYDFQGKEYVVSLEDTSDFALHEMFEFAREDANVYWESDGMSMHINIVAVGKITTFELLRNTDDIKIYKHDEKAEDGEEVTNFTKEFWVDPNPVNLFNYKETHA